MFIESLTIRKNGKVGEIIRQIKFRQGVNLILDKSNHNQSTETGNNVGKSTVLRLIGFCLGGKKEKIYQDPEFRGRNENANRIKQFLEKDKVYVELILTKNLSNQEAEKITIGRNFLNRPDKIQEINSNAVSNDDFPKKLAQLIFNFHFQKPSFRQIICRNIRHNTQALNNTVKPLDGYPSNSEYEAIYLYWMGMSRYSDSNKIELTTKLKTEETFKKQTEQSQGNTLNSIKQKILAYQGQIAQLNEQKKNFNLNENYIQDLEQLNQIKQTINQLKTQVVSLTMKKNLILESQAELDKTSPKIEIGKVQFLYSEAKKLLPNLQKSFEDVLLFHKKMIEEKKRFIGQELPQVDTDLGEYEKQQERLLEREAELSQKLQKTGALEELEQLIQQLTKGHEEKGRLEKVKEILEKTEANINQWKRNLSILNQRLQEENPKIEKKIASFNTHFAKISRSLYDEAFLLSHEFSESKGQTNLKLTIKGLEENPGTGGKRGEIIAFDLAYIQFAETLKIPHVNFILHDQIENIHDNQISTILLEAVQEINCQYVIPVLQDKLPENIDTSQYSVLTLSQNDKLFKLP